MRIVVVGQGAIGLLWYHNLKQHIQNHVTLVVSASADVNVEELNFTTLNETTIKTPLQYADKNDLANSDLVIFCVKAYQLKLAFEQHIGHISNNTPIMLCHNGMINENILPRKHAVISMLLTHGAKLNKAFNVQYTGAGTSDIGLIQGQLLGDAQYEINKALKQALPTVHWHNNIKEKQWMKLAINCVINPLTAINNCDNGNIVKSHFETTINDILSEVATLTTCYGLGFSVEELKTAVLEVALKTAKNCSSMRSDINANRRTEIDHINGFIHQQGQLYNVATPVNTQLWQQIKELEN